MSAKRDAAVAVMNVRRATPKELAAHLAISSVQVIRMVKDGVIPTVMREGRIYRFDLAEVDRVLEERARRKAAGVGTGTLNIELPTSNVEVEREGLAERDGSEGADREAGGDARAAGADGCLPHPAGGK